MYTEIYTEIYTEHIPHDKFTLYNRIQKYIRSLATPFFYITLVYINSIYLDVYKRQLLDSSIVRLYCPLLSSPTVVLLPYSG